MHSDPSDTAPATLLQILRAHIRLLVAGLLLGLALAIAYVNLAERKYAVTLVLVPTEDSSAALKQIGGGLSSLASLAGVNLPGGAGSLNFELLPDGMISRETAASLAKDETLLRGAFPSKWDDASRSWKEPVGTVAGLKKGIKNLASAILGVEFKPFGPPGPEEMQEFLQKRMTVSTDRKRPVITASILHHDPEFAKALLYRAWLDTDRRMKESSLARSTANIEYLTKRLAETQTLDYRLYLNTVMSQEEKRRMTTMSSLPFVAEPFGAPVASSRPVSPNILLALVAGPLIGLFLAFAVLVVRRRTEFAVMVGALLKSDPPA